MINGIHADDYCEESCALIYGYQACDIVEDFYEDNFGIGSDKPTLVLSKYRSIVDKSSLFDKNTRCTTSPDRSEVAKGVSFVQTKTCIESGYRLLTYSDGSQSKHYETNKYTDKTTLTGTKVSTVKSDALKTSTTLTQIQTKPTIQKYDNKQIDSNISSKNSVSQKALSTSTSLTQTSKPVTTTANTQIVESKNSSTQNSVAQKALSTSTSLTQIKDDKIKATETEQTIENTSLSTTDLAVGAAAIGTGVAVSSGVKNKALKTSTSLTSPTPKKPVLKEVSRSSWSNVGSPYSCSSWSPSASTKTKGTSFKQTQSCKQKIKQIVKFSDGSTKDVIDVKTVSNSKTAYGEKTKSISKSTIKKTTSSTKKSSTAYKKK